jgi:hypothetical protein
MGGQKHVNLKASSLASPPETAEPVHVLVVTPHFFAGSGGGSEEYCRLLVNELNREGLVASVFTRELVSRRLKY